MDPGISPGVQQLWVYPEAEPASESDGPKHPQRIIEKGIAGREGCPDQPLLKIWRSFPRVIFDNAGIDIVEQRIDR